ncbi:HpsJ-like protein, cyanoexosortase A-associated [Lyngbya aestuarii]|uniref:HpsJ-like protein, cyanoexosortase A-associated n=1 Tax=Lyngbya aestuarii TaxID=118322 RepID=UPI00403E00E9
MNESSTKLTEQLEAKVEVLRQYCVEILSSTLLLHWIGYGFLLFSLVELVAIIIPPQFMNPVWEFQTFGAIVERVVVLLLGFGLVFFGERGGRGKWELPLLKSLSWLAFLMAILFFLMIPLAIVNTLRIDRQNTQQITNQIEQGKNQIQQIQKQLQGVTTQQQMEELLTGFNSTGGSPQIGSGQQLEDVKGQLSSVLAQGETTISTRAKEVKADQRLNLLKSSVKWNLGALLTGVLLLVIWLSSSWTRKKSRRGSLNRGFR